MAISCHVKQFVTNFGESFKLIYQFLFQPELCFQLQQCLCMFLMKLVQFELKGELCLSSKMLLSVAVFFTGGKLTKLRTCQRFTASLT